MFGIYAQGLSGLRVDEPSELHDRASRRAQDQLLNLFDVAFDPVALAAEKGDLGDRGHHRVRRVRTSATVLPAGDWSQSEVPRPGPAPISTGAPEWGASVERVGDFAAREVLRADAAESPSDQPDRAGEGRRPMPTYRGSNAP